MLVLTGHSRQATVIYWEKQTVKYFFSLLTPPPIEVIQMTCYNAQAGQQFFYFYLLITTTRSSYISSHQDNWPSQKGCEQRKQSMRSWFGVMCLLVSWRLAWGLLWASQEAAHYQLRWHDNFANSMSWRGSCMKHQWLPKWGT